MFPSGLKTIYSRIMGTISTDETHNHHTSSTQCNDENQINASNSKHEVKRSHSVGNSVQNFEIEDSDDEKSAHDRYFGKPRLHPQSPGGRSFQQVTESSTGGCYDTKGNVDF